jgi:hypothetical protein
VFYLNDKIPDGPAFLFRTEGGGSIQVRAGSPRGAGARSDGGNGGRAAAAGVAAAAAAAHAAKAVAIKLAWAASDSSPTCGRWPTDADDALLRAFGVKTDGLAWRCAHYTVMERMRRPRGGRDAPADTNATCATWCTERADKHRAADGSWCCHWKPTRGGREAGICEWSDGIALHDVAADVGSDEAAPAAAGADDSEPLALAFEPCPNITIDDAAAGVPQLTVEPVPRGRCSRGLSRLGSLRAAADHETCITLCTAAAAEGRDSGCDVYAYSEAEAAHGRHSCELLSSCRAASGTNQLVEGGQRRRGSFTYYARVRAPSPPPPASPPAPPPPLRVVPKLVDSGRSRRPARTHILRKRFNASEEYVCDTSGGARSNNVMATFDKPTTGMCSQACVPNRLVRPAQKRGAILGADCKQSDCSQFVRVDKIVGVPYNVYTCACPTKNASAAYTCAP